MKQWMIRIFAGLILLAGIGLMGYPILSNVIYERQQKKLAEYYDSKIEEVTEEERNSRWDECDEYNRFLAADAAMDSDPFNNDLDPETLPYRDLLNIDGNGTMGSLEVPGITGKLMIYHGTREDVLQKGVGHLQGTSLPVGGASTHCVLSAHSGLPSKKLFTNLDQMEIGDVFYLHIMGVDLAYQVDQINKVLPHENEAIQIQPEGDYVTLVTCTPYGINSHRLLVRGTRISYEEAKALEAGQLRRGSTWVQQYIRAALIGLGIVVAIGLIIFLIRRWRRRKKTENEKTANKM